ncbi:MAG: PAS domain-containing protein, partial [Pedobacter sp.]
AASYSWLNAMGHATTFDITRFDQQVIGTMCLVDHKPRGLSKHEQDILQDLAKVVMEQAELRLANIDSIESQQSINGKLEHSEQHLKGILDTMAEGVTIVDSQGQPTYANGMAQKILDASVNELQDRAYNDQKWKNLHLDGRVLPEEDHPVMVMLNTGLAVYDQEIGIQKPDGEIFYITINAAPLFDNQSVLTGGVCTFMDTTNRRRLMKEKDDFISIASHELKTPITSLQAALQVLDRIKDRPNSPMMPELIAQANKSLNKLNSLVRDLLNVNRITAGQLELRKVSFTIADMINDCCAHIRSAGDYEISLTGDIYLKVNADENRIDQVVVNMVNNAIKYAPESAVIDIHVEKKADMARISVKDKGKGISPEKIPHLFDRYYRADYSGLQFSGLGLGLYISADIVKKHGGEIGVNSELGKGTEFWFTLPL